jgi:hypothetical protein
MRDEIDGRLWAEHHTEFSASVAELFVRIGKGLKRLHERQWNAPWRQGAGRRVNRPGHA